MANEYCRLLSNGFRFLEKKLTYQPCCWVPESPPIDSIEDLNRYREDITAKVLANKTKYCQECIRREKSNFVISHRQFAMNLVPDDAVDGEVVELGIQVSTTCNAACTICGPHYSSLWRKQVMDPRFPLLDTENEYYKLSKLLDLSKLKRIHVTGGEPLINDDLLIILKAIPNPENVTILYNTNGSIFPSDESLELWKKMNEIHLVFSIDDLDDRFHYIRWPLDLDKVKNNIEQFAKLDIVKKLMINCTINPLNIWYFDQLEEWINALSADINKPIKLTLGRCYGTWGIDAIPQKLREKVIEKYGNEHQIVKLLSTVDTDPTKWDLLLDDLKKLDASRNLSSQETFAEVFEIMNM